MTITIARTLGSLCVGVTDHDVRAVPVYYVLFALGFLIALFFLIQMNMIRYALMVLGCRLAAR
jgi:hypothetical protein